MHEEIQTKSKSGVRGIFKKKPTTMSMFILVNGIVIAAIAFVVLHHITNNQRMLEAHNATYGVIRNAEKTFNMIDKQMRRFARVFVEYNGIPFPSNTFGKGVDEVVFNNIIWVTAKDSPERYTWLNQQVGGYGDNQIAYISELPEWAFKDGKKSDEKQVGLSLKIPQSADASGILLVVTDLKSVFSSALFSVREDIPAIRIIDHDTGNAIIESR